ncbi:uncharacterized protein MONOS_1801 [Monocercomonoides exilis]|uniref:uncharacterized protein n=1 Tax=Monocercomonoides exilis TaxID=2049356 RepID=UPI0035595EBF|nr:hypothetical protein MONOS_1801 [Monocercomonoides exilis]|eukprot:MONOS_1801.1-p1 / transcript=MONOS_1801.1 / gene=MONOS_1801 / organism=Monocercomonoides_exilis_PA203 / gene_product=unspecified product / transcript_product=unspecified product / location=Mono_scaffold00034:10516-13386(-) / protein_length=706 / sequence_SO=supercontig / SO=protein_coding / is_pseudo=false
MQKEKEEETRKMRALEREKHTLSQEVAPTNDISRYLRILYMDIKSRPGKPPTELEIRQERDELEKLPTHVLLESLCTEMNILKSFRDNYQALLKKTAKPEKSRDSQLISSLREEITSMRNLLNRTTKEHTERLKVVQASDASSGQSIETLQATMEALRSDNQKLSEQLQIIVSEVDEAKGNLAQVKRTIQHQQVKMLRIAQLESKMHALKTQHNQEVEMIKKQEEDEVEERKIADRHSLQIEMRRQSLQEEVRKAQMQLRSFHIDLPRQKVRDSAEKGQRLEGAVKNRKKQLAAIMKELDRAKEAAELLATKNKEMKEEYEKLYIAANEEKRKTMIINGKSLRASSSSGKRRGVAKRGQNASGLLDDVLDGEMSELMDGTSMDLLKMPLSLMTVEVPPEERVYQKLIAIQESQIKSLSNEVKRLMQAERRTKVMSEARKEERVKFEEQLKQLKAEMVEVNAPPKTTKGKSYQKNHSVNDDDMYRQRAIAMSTAAIERLILRNMELEDELKDYRTIKAANDTVVSAYEKLLQQTAANKQTPSSSAISPSQQDQSSHLAASVASGAMMSKPSTSNPLSLSTSYTPFVPRQTKQQPKHLLRTSPLHFLNQMRPATSASMRPSSPIVTSSTLFQLRPSTESQSRSSSSIATSSQFPRRSISPASISLSTTSSLRNSFSSDSRRSFSSMRSSSQGGSQLRRSFAGTSSRF